MWFNKRVDPKLIELSSLLSETLNNLNEHPSQDEMLQYSSMAKEILNYAKKSPQGYGLNRAATLLAETINVWRLSQDSIQYQSIDDDPRFKNVVDALERLERAIERI